MRVALIGPVYPYRGGIAHYTTMLCRALRERGNHVLLVSFKRQYPQWLFPGRSDKDPSKQPLEVEDVQYWIDSLNPFTWLATFWRIRQYRPDVLILQWWTTFLSPVWSVLGVLNRIFLQKPLVYICHNVLPHEVRWWDSLLAKGVLRWGTHFIVQSEEEERRLLSLSSRAQTVVAPLPIFDMFANGRVTKVEARARLGLPPAVPVLLFFGIVREYKGLQDLLAALPEIRAQLGKMVLLVAGEFWEDKRPYQEMIERLAIDDSVIIDDRYIPNEEVPIYFSAADVLVAPYRRATGSAVIQMAVGNGCPVIATCVGNLAEVIQSNASGLLVQPSDSHALAEVITTYFRDPARPSGKKGSGDDKLSRWEQLVTSIESVGPGCE